MGFNSAFKGLIQPLA